MSVSGNFASAKGIVQLKHGGGNVPSSFFDEMKKQKTEGNYKKEEEYRSAPSCWPTLRSEATRLAGEFSVKRVPAKRAPINKCRATLDG